MIATHFIGGASVADGEIGDSINPADQSVVGQFHCGSAQLVDQAASDARAAFFGLDWAANPRLRSQALIEIADRLEAEKDAIADLVVLENGKLRNEALGETLGAISETRYYAGLTRNIRGTMQEVLPGQMSLFHREGRRCCRNYCTVERAGHFADALFGTCACRRLHMRRQTCGANTTDTCQIDGVYQRRTVFA